MRKLLNTVYINSDGYLKLENENLVLMKGNDILARIPLQNIESVFCFAHHTFSSGLLSELGKRNITLCIYNSMGRFKARVVGPVTGNVLLRTRQCQLLEKEEERILLARSIISAKIYNSKWVVERCCRDHPQSVDLSLLKEASRKLSQSGKKALEASNMDSLRGIEGQAATEYFSIFDNLIISQKNEFVFDKRTRRPPIGYVNALLSFAYSLAANDIVSACEGVGLDPYIGLNHVLRPGRPSLALDLLEELRPVMCDRIVLTLINTRHISSNDFIVKENNTCLLSESGRKKFLNAWQKKKQETLTHPFTQEKINWGLVPFAQAQLMASTIRGDLSSYPPFLWK